MNTGGRLDALHMFLAIQFQSLRQDYFLWLAVGSSHVLDPVMFATIRTHNNLESNYNRSKPLRLFLIVSAHCSLSP